MTQAAGSKTCFFIGHIGDHERHKKWANALFEDIIKPVAIKHGYQLFHWNEIADPGIIGGQIIRRLVKDDLVIADLTMKNPNVFYELAIRHMVNRPVIQFISKDEKLPFDVAHIRTIFVANALGGAKAAMGELELQLTALERGADNYSPIPNEFTLPSMQRQIEQIRSAQGLLEEHEKNQVTLRDIVRTKSWLDRRFFHNRCRDAATWLPKATLQLNQRVYDQIEAVHQLLGLIRYDSGWYGKSKFDEEAFNIERDRLSKLIIEVIEELRPFVQRSGESVGQFPA